MGRTTARLLTRHGNANAVGLVEDCEVVTVDSYSGKVAVVEPEFDMEAMRSVALVYAVRRDKSSA